jgi:hypothetical protein
MPNNNCEVHTTMAGFGYPANGLVCSCIQPGDFSNLDCGYGSEWYGLEMTQTMFKAAYDAITLTDEGWTFMKEFNTESFMFGKTPPQLEQINKNIEKLYPGHSGWSYGYTMRAMQFIAKNGWDAYANAMKPKPLQAFFADSVGSPRNQS